MGIGHKFKPVLMEGEAPEWYVCACCSNPLFSSSKQFDAGCGFPSFWGHEGDHVRQHTLHTYGRTRIQLRCSQCDSHLGHLFGHPHTPSQLRYCISASAIRPSGKA